MIDQNAPVKKSGSKAGLIVGIIITVILIIGIAGYFFLYRSGTYRTKDGATITYKKSGNVVTQKQDGTTFSIGEGVTKPKDFPANIPLYPKATYTSYLADKQMNGYTATTTDKPEVILAWFKEQVVKTGWKIDLTSKDSLNISNNESAGGIVIVSDENGKYSINFSAASKSSSALTDENGQQTYDDTIKQAQELEKQAEELGIPTE